MSSSAVWYPPSEGCMGNKIEGYWCVSREARDGSTVYGYDKDRDVAEFKATSVMAEKNAVLAMTPLQQLDKLCQPEHMCHNDMVRAIKLINGILQIHHAQ